MTPDVVTIEDTGGLGPIEIEIPPGRQTVTPASRMAVAAIGTNSDLLGGRGLDWGTGTGLLAIGAAIASGVDRVVGLELDGADLPVAKANAQRNRVGARTHFIHADSYAAIDPADQASIDDLRGAAGFLIANPPASRSGDGLDWRRAALRGGLAFLVSGAPVLVQISYQYALDRIAGLAADVPGYRYVGLAGSSEWVQFDQTRADLSRQVVEYAAVEAEGGIAYTFSDGHGGHLSATEALARYRATGESPLSKWQMHLFRRT